MRYQGSRLEVASEVRGQYPIELNRCGSFWPDEIAGNFFRYFNISSEVIRLTVTMQVRYPLSPRWFGQQYAWLSLRVGLREIVNRGYQVSCWDDKRLIRHRHLGKMSFDFAIGRFV